MSDTSDWYALPATLPITVKWGGNDLEPSVSFAHRTTSGARYHIVKQLTPSGSGWVLCLRENAMGYVSNISLERVPTIVRDAATALCL